MRLVSRIRALALLLAAATVLATSGCVLDNLQGNAVDEAVADLDPNVVEVTQAVGGFSQGRIIRANVLEDANPDSVTDAIWQPVSDHDIDSLELILPNGVWVDVSSEASGEDAVRALLHFAYDDDLTGLESARLDIGADGSSIDLTDQGGLLELYDLAESLRSEHGVEDARGHLASIGDQQISLRTSLSGSDAVRQFAAQLAEGLAAPGFADLLKASATLDHDEHAASIVANVESELPSTVDDATALHAQLAAFEVTVTVRIEGADGDLVSLP